MAKALFFNVPAHGHMNPTFPLVAELVQRGDQVIYYASETFQAAIEQTGATFRTIGSFFDEQTYVDENLVRFAYRLISVTQDILPAILPEVTAEKPDYIIYDSLCVWGKCIAQILQVPAIASVTSLASIQPSLHPEMFVTMLAILPIATRSLFEGRKEFRKFLAITRQLHETYHIPRPQITDVYENLAELNIVYATKQLQLYPNSFNDTYKFVGPAIGIRPEAAPFALDELENKPIIYISLGTIFNAKENFYRLCLKAFGDLNYHVIMSVGSKTDIASLGTIPANFSVGAFLPQVQILQHTSLFITHAGMNSISEGLSAGVPLLMLPQAADQTFIARRIQQLGAGKVLDNTKLSAQILYNAATEILAQPAFQKVSASVGASFRQAGGIKMAVDEIEAFKHKKGLL
jgi:MGT family glycosyltransferase